MNAPANTASVSSLREQQIAPREASLPQVAPGFGSLQSFELMQRQAKLFSSSTLVPAAYRATIDKTDRFGDVTESRENPNALANAVVALNMAQRMGADPLMVMQNLYIVEGRPSWSSQWIIASINGCGRFSPLRFEITDLGEKDVEYVSFVWGQGASGRRERSEKRQKVRIRDKKCVAWAIEKETEARVESPAVTIEMAVKEGWYTKNGSKWQTMDEVMLRYRTASFFGKIYSPELLMGLLSVEEAQEIVTLDVQPDGTYAPAQPAQTIDQLRGRAAPTEEHDDSDVVDAEFIPDHDQPAQIEQQAASDFQPSASEIAEIRAREMADARADSSEEDQPRRTRRAQMNLE